MAEQQFGSLTWGDGGDCRTRGVPWSTRRHLRRGVRGRSVGPVAHYLAPARSYRCQSAPISSRVALILPFWMSRTPRDPKH
jgi:hypothetical protein